MAAVRQDDLGRDHRANGRPNVKPNTDPTEAGTEVCPDITGGTNFQSPAYSPKTGLFYVTAREICATYYGWEQEFVPGEYYFGGAAQRTDRGFGALRAIDPATGSVRWEFKHYTPSMAGVLSTASGLVFGGDMDGNVMAFDAATGKNSGGSSRLGDLRGADHVHDRRTAVGGDAVRDDAQRLRAACGSTNALGTGDWGVRRPRYGELHLTSRACASPEARRCEADGGTP